MNTQLLNIGITGHRLLLNRAEVRADICRSLRYFGQSAAGLTGITALAGGADTIFAEEMLQAGGQLRIVLPFAAEEYRNDFASEESRRKFDLLLQKNSGNVSVVQGRLPADQAAREEAYFAAGRRIVDEADILLAVWDREAANGRGGTGDIVAYAQAQGKQVHIIDAVRKEHPVRDAVAQLFERLDGAAVAYKRRIFEPVWLTGLITGVLAVTCFGISTAYPGRADSHGAAGKLAFALAIAEVVLITASFILLTFFANQWKHRFLTKRREAEYLRTLIWFRNARIPVFPPVPKENDAARSDDFQLILSIEKEYMAQVTTIADLADARRMLWCLADAQCAYHQEKCVRRFGRKKKRVHHLSNVVKILFFTAVGSRFAVELAEHSAHGHVPGWMTGRLLPLCMLLIIALPSVYAMLEGIKYFGDWKRKIRTSERTIAELKESKERILAAKDTEELTAESRILRNVLELENTDWLSQYIELEIEAGV